MYSSPEPGRGLVSRQRVYIGSAASILRQGSKAEAVVAKIVEKRRIATIQVRGLVRYLIM